MPRRWNKLVLVGGGFFGAVAIWLLAVRESEPSYEGQALSGWIATFNSTNSAADVARARDAIEHIGPDAIPFLLRWCDYEPSGFNRSVWQLLPNSIGHTKGGGEVVVVG